MYEPPQTGGVFSARFVLFGGESFFVGSGLFFSVMRWFVFWRSV